MPQTAAPKANHSEQLEFTERATRSEGGKWNFNRQYDQVVKGQPRKYMDVYF
jgi:hypothetical protein